MRGVSRYPPTPKAGYGPWLVAMAALLLALAALVVLLARGATETRYVDLSPVDATGPPGTDCIDGVAVARGAVRADRTGRLRLRKSAVGGTLHELDGRVDAIAIAGLAGARCRVEPLTATPDCTSSLTAPRVVTVVAGPTRQGYGETGAGAILGASGAGTGTGSGGLRGELRLVDHVTLRPRVTIAGHSDLLSRACTSGRAGTQPAGLVDAGTPGGDQPSAAPASAPVRDLALVGGLVLALAAIAATMGRGRVRSPGGGR